MRPEPTPATQGPSPAPAADRDPSLGHLDKLAAHVAELEASQRAMLETELARLSELTTLTRVAESLSRRRTFAEVLEDCLDEVCHIAGHNEAWIVEANPDNPIGAVHGPARSGEPSHSPLPREVRDLCQRVYANRPRQSLLTSANADRGADTACFAMPIFTAKHLLGTLVVRDPGLRLCGDATRMRLLQCVLRQTAMAAENDRLMVALNQMIIEVCCSFALAIESRDAYTGGHVQRVTAYGILLAKHIGLDARQQSILRLGGLLHDIGKVAIPDAVLNKPGKLTDEEFNIIKLHPVVGHQVIAQIPQLLCVNEIIRHHHERWDGKGYPDRLAGTDIPLLARVLAIADTFDAMTSSRSYRGAMSIDKAMTEIRRCAGTQFDAEMAAGFALFEKPQLDQACDEMRLWCQVSNHTDRLTIMDMMDLRMPAMG